MTKADYALKVKIRYMNEHGALHCLFSGKHHINEGFGNFFNIEYPY